MTYDEFLKLACDCGVVYIDRSGDVCPGVREGESLINEMVDFYKAVMQKIQETKFVPYSEIGL